MNKRNKGAVESYRRSTAYSLSEVYGKYSQAKANAWDYCLGLMQKHNGKALKVISFNSMIFTAGFLFTNENNVECLMYITPSRDTIIELEEDM